MRDRLSARCNVCVCLFVGLFVSNHPISQHLAVCGRRTATGLTAAVSEGKRAERVRFLQPTGTEHRVGTDRESGQQVVNLR